MTPITMPAIAPPLNELGEGTGVGEGASVVASAVAVAEVMLPVVEDAVVVVDENETASALASKVNVVASGLAEDRDA